MADKYNGKYPVAWTADEVEAYTESGIEPSKASNGVWVTDVTRDEKDLVQWTVAELYALYNGELISVNSPGDEAFLLAVRVKARLSNSEAGKWSDDELFTWLMSGKEPAKTKAGNYKNDPERFTKDVHLLNDSELIDFGLGEFGDYDSTREYVLVEALDRFKLPLGTTFEDYANYCANRTPPPIATHGSLVNDRKRAGKLLSEWSSDELMDWGLGEIDNAGKTESSLLELLIKDLSGEWYWTKANCSHYISTNELPTEDELDLDDLSTLELLKYIKSTQSLKAFTLWTSKAVVKAMTPDEFTAVTSGDVVPLQWEDEGIHNYAFAGTVPVAFNGSTWYNDVTRAGRLPDGLSVDEVEGCYRETLHFTEADRAAVLAAAAEALRVHGDEVYHDLYDADALALYFDKVEPAKTESGIYVSSKTRDEEPLEEWTFSEVRAYLTGELKTTKVIDEDALVIANSPQWEGLGSVAERKQWLIDMTGPAVTENGVLIEDPKRCTTSIENWTDAELIALAQGWIKGLFNVSEELLIDRLFERQLIPSSDWSLKQVTQFLTDGTEPAATDFGNGKVKYDEYTITRKSDLKFYSDWANGQITLPNTQAEVLNRVRAIIGANTATDAEILDMLKAYKGDGSDKFKELSLHEQLQDGTEESRRKVVDLWHMSADTSAEWAMEAYEAMDKATFTRNDVLIVDERRDVKAAYLWSLEELRSWARGEIGPGTSSDTRSLVQALRKNISMIGDGWDDTAVKTFAATGEQPAMTSTGVLVTDVARDRKYPTDWSDADLKAWAAGEIRTPVRPADILLAIRSRFKVPSKYTDRQVLTFVVTGEEPPVEPEKPFTNAVSATDNQIKAWLRSEFEVPADVMVVAFKETRARFKSDPHWTDAAIRLYYTDGTLPAKTSNGLFVEDRLRDITTVIKWSYKEAEAFAKGEIKAPAIPAKGAEFLARARVLITVEKGLPADKWAVGEVLTYLTTGTPPTILTGNVFAHDPIREGKAALSWSNDELKAFLRGDITFTVKAPEADLWTVIYNRFQVPNAWYPVDARSYVLTGAVVPSTPSGIWVRDRERDQRSAWTWTRAEVKAWARGQILPGLHAPEKDLVQQATICFNLSSSLSDAFIKSKVAAITEDTTPMTVSFVRDDLLSFAAGMKKEGADEVKAAGYQSMLNRCIVRVTQLRGQDFVDGWTELLKFYFNQKGSIFSPGTLYNGVAMMQIASKAQKNFQQLTTVLFQTCDPATRDAAVKRVDWVIALAGLPSDDARHQILAFYNVG